MAYQWTSDRNYLAVEILGTPLIPYSFELEVVYVKY